MFQSFQQARDFIDKSSIEAIDFKFCDLWGRWHHLTIPSAQLNADLMEHGVGFDGSSVGLKSVKSGDMVLIPDLSTAFLDPFWDSPTLSFICTTYEADTHASFANDPRNIARRAEEYMRTSGLADESRWGGTRSIGGRHPPPRARCPPALGPSVAARVDRQPPSRPAARLALLKANEQG